MLNIGDSAPDFCLFNQDNSKISLSGYAGKWIILYFYPRDNTPGCTREACDFSDSIGFFVSLNTHIIGISPDNISSHIKFINKFGLKISLLSDTGKNVFKNYGAWGKKKNYGKEYEGVIRSTFIISPNGKVAEKWHNVKVRKKTKDGEIRHVDIVKKRLADLQND